MIVYPKAKINVGLKIIEKRPDGFHNLETLFYPVESLSDILEIVESERFSFNLYGARLEGADSDNLVVKAYNIVKENHNIPPAEIHLYKRIPSGAGLGGGSSDASYTIVALNKLFDLNMSLEEMLSYAAMLGSDCPYFIYESLSTEVCSMLATGRGEILEPYEIEELKRFSIEVVKPPVFVSTAEAYAGVTPQKPSRSLVLDLNEPIESWRGLITNDFERSLFKKYPLIEETKEEMYRKGAVYASMSGSGSAVYGIFPIID